VYWDSTTAAWTVGSQQIQLGGNAGATGQGQEAVAIGFNAGSTGQSLGSIAIGSGAGQTGQGGTIGYAIAIGQFAGSNNQGESAIFIGGQSAITGTNGGQGPNAIAIGYDSIDLSTVQVANSIVLNGMGTPIDTTIGSTITAPGLFVNPIQSGPDTSFVLMWDPAAGTATSQITYSSSNAKSFVIDHPLDPINKHLVHCCLEGPEAGVYYRGKSEIVNGTSAEIQLPSYVGALCTDLTVQITHIYDGTVKAFSASEVDTATNTFTVHGENGRFNWLVHGKRDDVTAEVNKADVTVCGDGPYKYFA